MKLFNVIGLSVLILFSTGCDLAPKVEFELETLSGEVVKMKCPHVKTGEMVFNYCYVVD